MNLKNNTRQEMIDEMKLVYCRDDNHNQMNCAMIDCTISIVDFGKLVKFHRFSCFSYSETWGGLSGLLMDKVLNMMFHFTATKKNIMIYPVHNKDYNAESFVDFYELIHKKIDNRARLFLYPEYQKVMKQEEKEFQEYMAEQEKKKYEENKNGT